MPSPSAVPVGMTIELIWYLLLCAVSLFGFVGMILLGVIAWFAKHSYDSITRTISKHEEQIDELTTGLASLASTVQALSGNLANVLSMTARQHNDNLMTLTSIKNDIQRMVPSSRGDNR